MNVLPAEGRCPFYHCVWCSHSVGICCFVCSRVFPCSFSCVSLCPSWLTWFSYHPLIDPHLRYCDTCISLAHQAPAVLKGGSGSIIVTSMVTVSLVYLQRFASLILHSTIPLLSMTCLACLGNNSYPCPGLHWGFSTLTQDMFFTF